MFMLIRLTQHVSGIIMPIVTRTDYVNNCMWSMPGCVGCSCAGWATTCVHCVMVGVSQLCTTAANTTRHTPHAVVYIVCSPVDGHNDARNMLS